MWGDLPLQKATKPQFRRAHRKLSQAFMSYATHTHTHTHTPLSTHTHTHTHTPTTTHTHTPHPNTPHTHTHTPPPPHAHTHKYPILTHSENHFLSIYLFSVEMDI